MVRDVKTIVHMLRFLDLLSHGLPQEIYLEVSVKFKCSFATNKAEFFIIFETVRRNASEKVLFALIKSKCLPILFYGIEACPIINSTV